MSEMVEQVARALCKARFLNGWIEDDDGWDSCPERLKLEYLACARAAIDAMRVPTKKMISVGLEYIEEGDPCDAWQAMIDTALGV